LGEFDLEHAFTSSRAACKDVEDELGAVDDFTAQTIFEVSLLGTADLAIDEDEVGSDFFYEGEEFIHLAFADVGGLVWHVEALAQGGQWFDMGGFAKSLKFFFDLRIFFFSIVDVDQDCGFDRS
jgi:hypothetical protein